MIEPTTKKVINQRRVFVKYLPFMLAGTLSYPAGKFIFFSEIKDQSFMIALNKIKDGMTEIKKHSVYIYKKGNKIEVLNAHCTHMGCIINFYKKKDKFICPCHHSEFSISGKVIKGPAKRNLVKIPFKIKHETLYVS